MISTPIMKLTYPYETAPDGDSVLITFPDIPEAITGVNPGEDFDYMVRDCVKAALGFYLMDGEPLPKPSPANGRSTVTIDTSTIE